MECFSYRGALESSGVAKEIAISRSRHAFGAICGELSRDKVDASPYMLGVVYYPEQWPTTQVAEDFSKMRDIGISFVRMGEFA